MQSVTTAPQKSGLPLLSVKPSFHHEHSLRASYMLSIALSVRSRTATIGIAGTGLGIRGLLLNNQYWYAFTPKRRYVRLVAIASTVTASIILLSAIAKRLDDETR